MFLFLFFRLRYNKSQVLSDKVTYASALGGGLAGVMLMPQARVMGAVQGACLSIGPAFVVAMWMASKKKKE